MANDKKTFQDRLAEEMNEAILNASDEEILEEARAAGDDTEDFAARMRDWLASAGAEVGDDLMRKARVAVDRENARVSENVGPMRRKPSSPRPRSLVPDTMAARRGKSLSERDKKNIEEDLNGLFDDDAWGDKDDEDR